jgi:hypothetical protein
MANNFLNGWNSGWADLTTVVGYLMPGVLIIVAGALLIAVGLIVAGRVTTVIDISRARKR